ncbi:zinc ribbon domain-containing protein [Latilactobacillus sakei]|uniref:zinc ribbon domain-containing protein n=1 Tax=Latilactobacillus sakei TaxID=1599 RepID=UPI000DC6458F|nr:zinc ribbon domain-containing protein [Latilactobacillus sakei]SPS07556.1 hypothetical protein LAS9624_01812 [Latilactobacillus sakei]
MICPNCHTQNKQGSKFCIQCGNALTVQPLSEMNQQQVPPLQTRTQAKPAGNWAAKNKKYLWGILILVLLFRVPYYQKYQNDRTVLKQYDALYTTKKHEYLGAKVTNNDITNLDSERIRLKLGRSQQKAEKLQSQTEQKYKMLGTVNNLYTHSKLVGSTVKKDVGISVYTSIDQVNTAQKEAKKLPDDQFKTTVTQLLADTKADIKRIDSLHSQIYDLISQTNYDNGTIDSKTAKIKSEIKKVTNTDNRNSLTDDLDSELDKRADAEEGFEAYSRQSDIQNLSDVRDLDDLESYNSDLTPQNIALYVYSEMYDWDGRRRTTTTETESDYADGKITDTSNDDVMAYWKLEDDGTLTFYRYSDLTDEKKDPVNAFTDYNESDMLDYIRDMD